MSLHLPLANDEILVGSHTPVDPDVKRAALAFIVRHTTGDLGDVA